MDKKRIEKNKRNYVKGPRMTHEEIMAGLMGDTGEDSKDSTGDTNTSNTNKEPKSSTNEVGSIF